jgi:hypothetical protein
MKRRIPGRNAALRRILRPISSETRVDTPTEARKTSMVMVRGDQAGARWRDPQRIASALMSASIITERCHGSGRTNPER